MPKAERTRSAGVSSCSSTADLRRTGRDPALARAITALGGNISAADAGKLFKQ
jgi:hypothetical protein